MISCKKSDISSKIQHTCVEKMEEELWYQVCFQTFQEDVPLRGGSYPLEGELPWVDLPLRGRFTPEGMGAIPLGGA